MANVEVDVGSVTLGVISGFGCSFFASGKRWEMRRVLCDSAMSLPLAEQSVLPGVCVTFAGCRILGMAPSDPPQGLAWRSRP